MVGKKSIIAVINGKGFLLVKDNNCGGEVSVAYALYNDGVVKFFGPNEETLEANGCTLIRPFSIEQAKKLLWFKANLKNINQNHEKAPSE